MKGEWLTSHTEPLTGDRSFHLLCHRVVGSTFVSPLILLAGINDLKVSRWHNKVIVCRERREDGTWSQNMLLSSLEDMQCPEEKVDKGERKKTPPCPRQHGHQGDHARDPKLSCAQTGGKGTRRQQVETATAGKEG